MLKRVIIMTLMVCLIFTAAMAQARETARGHITEGQAHMQAGRFDAAITSFESALRLEPRNRQLPPLLLEAQTKRTDFIFAEAQRLQQAGHFEEAIAMYDAAVESAPSGYNTRNITHSKEAAIKARTDHFVSEAQRLQKEGSFDEAITHYDLALQSAPHGYNTRSIQNARTETQNAKTNAGAQAHTEQFFAEGQRLQEAGSLTEAIEQYDLALQSAPRGYNTNNIRNARSEAIETRGNLSKQALEKAIELITAAKYSEALAELENAVSIGGLHQSIVNITQNAITVLKDLPARQAAYNRQVRDDDFEIKQIQNGIEISGFKASETINIHIQTPNTQGRNITIVIGIQNVVIPNRLYNLPVTNIGTDAFRNKNLTSVTLPNALVTIGSGAFSDNKNLTRIVIPNSVINVGLATTEAIGVRGAFQDCGLTSVTLGNAVRVIGHGAFLNNKLTSITLPASVREVWSRAFSNNQIESFTFPNGVTIIGYIAGDGPLNGNPLTTLVIPASITGNTGFFYGKFPNTLTRVTLPANIIYGMEDSFEQALCNFYEGQGRRAGVYVKNGPVWSRQ